MTRDTSLFYTFDWISQSVFPLDCEVILINLSFHFNSDWILTQARSSNIKIHLFRDLTITMKKKILLCMLYLNIQQGRVVTKYKTFRGRVGSSFFTFIRLTANMLRFCPEIYLFWRRAGHQRCFSPTWLRRAEAPRLWASSMTPHGSCPGGAPVTATWKTHTEDTSTIVKRQTYKPKLNVTHLKMQTYSTSCFALPVSLVSFWESIEWKYCLSPSEELSFCVDSSMWLKVVPLTVVKISSRVSICFEEWEWKKQATSLHNTSLAINTK